MKEEILDGLKLAVSKGESLESAIASFYNAGYTQQDINDALHVFQSYPYFKQGIQEHQQQEPPSAQVQKIQTRNPVPSIPRLPNTQYQTQPVPPLATAPQMNYGVVQRISEYGAKPSRTGTAITATLFALLLVLLAALVAVILFKDELSTLFNSLFWRALF